MKIKTTRENLKIIVVIVNLFFPGLGNILYGQKVFGFIVFIASSLLTCFYFYPLWVIASGEIENGSSSIIPLLISIFAALIAFMIDLGLVVVSIVKLARADK